jgi:hypothetical protein
MTMLSLTHKNSTGGAPRGGVDAVRATALVS